MDKTLRSLIYFNALILYTYQKSSMFSNKYVKTEAQDFNSKFKKA